MNYEEYQQSQMILRQQNGANGETTPVTVSLKKASSLENLQQLMRSLQREQIDEKVFGSKSATVRVGRSRITNESFRVAVDKSYDSGYSGNNGEAEAMETVDEEENYDQGSEGSFQGNYINRDSQNSMGMRRRHTVHRYHDHHPANYSSVTSRPSATSSLFTSVTHGTTETNTSSQVTTDEDNAVLVRSHSTKAPKEGKKQGIFKTLLRLGSGKKKKNKAKITCGSLGADEDQTLSPVSDSRSYASRTTVSPKSQQTEIVDLDKEDERMRIRREMELEQQKIKEHFRRLVQSNQIHPQPHHPSRFQPSAFNGSHHATMPLPGKMIPRAQLRPPIPPPHVVYGTRNEFYPGGYPPTSGASDSRHIAPPTRIDIQSQGHTSPFNGENGLPHAYLGSKSPTNQLEAPYQTRINPMNLPPTSTHTRQVSYAPCSLFSYVLGWGSLLVMGLWF